MGQGWAQGFIMLLAIISCHPRHPKKLIGSVFQYWKDIGLGMFCLLKYLYAQWPAVTLEYNFSTNYACQIKSAYYINWKVCKGNLIQFLLYRETVECFLFSEGSQFNPYVDVCDIQTTLVVNVWSSHVSEGAFSLAYSSWCIVSDLPRWCVAFHYYLEESI